MFSYIVSQNNEILNGNLSLEDWNLRAQYLISIIAESLYYFHYSRQLCHLDISLENLLIAELIDIKTGKCLQIVPKIIDFGLSSVFIKKIKNKIKNKNNNNNAKTTTITSSTDLNNVHNKEYNNNHFEISTNMTDASNTINTNTKSMTNDSLTSLDFELIGINNEDSNSDSSKYTKYVGKNQYKSPLVYYNQPYDAFLADVWSFGILIFIIILRMPPFLKPDVNNLAFQLVVTGNLSKLLKSYNKFNEIPELALDLLNNILTSQQNRYNMKQVINHPYIKNAPTFNQIRQKWCNNV